MNIDWIIPCRYAEVHDNLATIVGAGIDTWWVAELPATIQVFMTMRLLATADEFGPDQEHRARSVVRDPGGATVSELDGTFQIGTEEEAARARTDWLNGIAITSVIVIEAQSEGTYTFEQIVDGSSISVPLHIVHGLPPGAPPPPE